MSGLIWLLVAAGLGLGALAWLAVRSRRWTAAPPVPAGAAALDAEDIRRALADTLGGMVGRVPPDVIARYESIHRRMLAMLPQMGRLEGTSEDLFVLRRTAADYLPTAVQSYLGLAGSGAGERRLPDGRTPREVLLEQLDLIETRLADIADALERRDVDRLLVHGRFLEARFGGSRDGLTAPEPGQAG